MRYLLISLLMCAVLVPIAGATTYKWVDESGQTVYSQTPPPAGTKGVERIKAPPRPSSNPDAAAQKTREDAASFNERRDERVTAEQDRQKIQQAETERRKLCEELNQDIDTLTTRPVVRRAPADGGEPVVLSAEDREAEVRSLRERISKECK